MKQELWQNNNQPQQALPDRELYDWKNYFLKQKSVHRAIPWSLIYQAM